ncbi:MAG TPA: Rieske 2Fe-2S domain-containing protein [Acidimicrobiales bacterium]|nr:Rieske 2Fe-2S domain-containing protein [Acidimicrobiales bacterium]
MTAEAWVEVTTTAQLARERKRVVRAGDVDVVVIWHDGAPYALANRCVHKDRELARGTVFSGRIVCPGHQWAFDLDTGWCREKEEHQPVYRVKVEGDVVYVDASSAAEVPDPA